MVVVGEGDRLVVLVVGWVVHLEVVVAVDKLTPEECRKWASGLWPSQVVRLE
jgi:hypothetical protein